VAWTLWAAGVLGLLGVAARTARPRRSRLPETDEHLRAWSALHAGIDPHGNRVVLWWLRGMYRLARPLARRGIHPDVVTASGLWLAFGALVAASGGGRWPLLATGFLVAGSVTDGLDGTLAVLTDRATRWGGVLDAVVDRASDVVLLGALVMLGGGQVSGGRSTLQGSLPAGAVAAGGALFALEYLRARAGESGARITTITVGERPTRLVLTGVSLWCAGLFPARAAEIGSVGAWSVCLLSVLGFGQLLPVVRRELLRPSR
jgi:CDP-diacylglycerol--glycerol-3-phosphate 3-phosphatidyltransferase